MFSSIVAVMAAALLALVSTLGLWPVQRPDSAVSSGADGLARVQLTDVAGQRTAAAKGGLTPGAALALRTGPISVGEFLVAGLSWAAGEQLPADAEIRMRVREDTGWSDWLEVGPDGASDDPAARNGTDPFVTGGADAVQVLVTGSPADLPADLRLVLVGEDDDGASAAASSAFRPGTVGLAAPAAVSATSIATVSTPAGYVHTRADWGLTTGEEEYTTLHWTPKFYPLQAAVIHHTAGTNSYTAEQSAGIVKSIWQYHAVERGWGDIGYNFLVDKYGQMFEGRRHSLPYSVSNDVPAGWSIEAAHAAGYNKGGLGISALGDYTKREKFADPSNPLLLDAIAKLAGWKLDQANLDVIDEGDRVGSGYISPGTSSTYPAGTELPRIFVHKDVSATLCPGSIGDAAVVDEIYDLVDARITQDSDTTPPSVSLAAEDGTVTLTASDSVTDAPAIFHTTDGSQVFYSPDWDWDGLCGDDLEATGVTNPRSCVGDTRYSEPFTLSESATVSYVAVDAAANTSVQQSTWVEADGSVTPNAAPAVSITAPADGTSFTSGATVSFSGSATDAEDGDLTGSLVWTSDLGGQIGTGGSFTAGLSDGTHVITASATDSGGLVGTDTIVISIENATDPDPTAITLTVVAYKDRGSQVAELSWTGTTEAVDVYRDGDVVQESVMASSYTHVPGIKGGGTATYKVCEAVDGGACSNEVTVTW